jgi:hypothetical protein
VEIGDMMRIEWGHRGYGNGDIMVNSIVDNCSNSIHGQNMGKEHDTLIPLEWRIWIYCRIDPHMHYFDTPRKTWWMSGKKYIHTNATIGWG